MTWIELKTNSDSKFSKEIEIFQFMSSFFKKINTNDKYHYCICSSPDVVITFQEDKKLIRYREGKIVSTKVQRVH